MKSLSNKNNYNVETEPQAAFIYSKNSERVKLQIAYNWFKQQVKFKAFFLLKNSKY